MENDQMITRLRRRQVLLTAGMTLLLAACSGGSAPATATVSSRPTATPASSAAQATPVTGTTVPSTKPVGGASGVIGNVADPCSKLTQSEVDAAMGQPLGAGKQVPLDDCQWATSDFAADVLLTFADWSSITQAAMANGGAPTAVPGLGDEAASAVGANGALLYVRKGGQGFMLIINGPNVDSLPDHGLAQEKVLAAAVLGRL
jgi:hypothetical protein